MESFRSIESFVIPIPLKDIDTDQIIPARYLTSVSRDGYAEGLFRNFCEQDPAFPLNQDRFQGAQILCTDSNFGCGSSREHAAWALLGWGIRVVIAPSFADIFFSNSAKNGLVLVTLPDTTVQEILTQAARGNLHLTVDLADQTVRWPEGRMLHFDFDPFRKECILNGYDDLDYIVSHKPDIDAFKEKREREMYFSTQHPNRPLS